jgi:CrcB protein
MTGVAWIAFLVAAAIGAPARYLIDGLVQDHTDGAFPWGTFVVNVSGCFVLGIITGLGLYHGLGSTTRTVVGTGAMGAYTTFSTFTFETVRLAEEGATNEALRNVAATFVVGLAAASAGLALAALI